MKAVLDKISSNKSGCVIAVSSKGVAQGLITDGDIRRWLALGSGIDLNESAIAIANRDFFALPFGAPPKDVEAALSSHVRLIPLTDEAGHLIAIARAGSPGFVIGERRISDTDPVFVIAEIGNNHNGDVSLAKRLIELAVEAGADCVKFQMRDMSALYSAKTGASDASQDLGSQYTLDLLSRFNLDPRDLFMLFDYCRARGVEPLCTPWDYPSLLALDQYGMQGYKVASADFTNHTLLQQMAGLGRPLICSTGMSTELEIKSSVDLLQKSGTPFALLHVNSTYPTPYKDVNLAYLGRLKEFGGAVVGYSGHERGWFIPVAAVALGAKIVEKHFTVDRTMEGNDHKVSLLPEEFRAMVEAIRSTETALGVKSERMITQGEMMNREILAKSIFAAHDLAEGSIVKDADVVIRSPGQGLQPNRLPDLIGLPVRRHIQGGTPFFPSDLEEARRGPRNFDFSRPWGLPVRWHDYQRMKSATNLDLLEYHLSYKDMEEDLSTWFSDVVDVEFLVHAPELFAGDHVLDLVAEDRAYRDRSILELQRVCDLTRRLNEWHPRTAKPLIIVNMGGFSSDGFRPKGDRQELYRRLEDSLGAIDASGVELIPQTMPPFPWHFGGQSHHNLFVDPWEIEDFCKMNEMRICFDLSHSQLACNHFGWSMSEFCDIVARFTAHLHIVDARGIDGEGLQIGDGDMDFAAIAEVLSRDAPHASFIPEIWQGHKDDGAGFWYALDKLERWFGTPV
ncbi:N-acetylneuraminate synthase family protein [Sphingomonas sp. R647]|uniref:N-acetylneuraminate synthase family protein n=1 Tax=Sphingomonas sp. R647 TaxID=2875233 RepID=UPI001CD5E39C|nr:N-acetylneuraminate synthase family protein [Sphingomonas sp. R647]MCA1200124.1 N-acetylneuraminate synthase family protein [Sphingomonas sp. R647]